MESVLEDTIPKLFKVIEIFEVIEVHQPLALFGPWMLFRVPQRKILLNVHPLRTFISGSEDNIQYEFKYHQKTEHSMQLKNYQD